MFFVIFWACVWGELVDPGGQLGAESQEEEEEAAKQAGCCYFYYQDYHYYCCLLEAKNPNQKVGKCAQSGVKIPHSRLSSRLIQLI